MRLSELKGLQTTEALEADRERLTERWREERPWMPMAFWALTSEEAQRGGLMGESGDAMLPERDESDADTEDAGADPGGDGDRRLRGR